MSMAPLGGIAASAAGAPLSQTKGSETERALKQGMTSERQQQTDLAAEAASGIGKTEHEEQASDRDADGRRLWEDPSEKDATDEDDQQQEPPPPRNRDLSGDSGNTLDLIG
jgi:hypothetical protein